MTNKFLPGAKVLASMISNSDWDDPELSSYIYTGYSDYTLTGLVLDKPASSGKVYVQWEEAEWDLDYDNGMEVDTELLILESELPQIEKDFNLAKTQIKEKIKEAAALIEEAGEIAIKARALSLKDMYDVVGPLIGAMDGNGWNSSSWGC